MDEGGSKILPAMTIKNSQEEIFDILTQAMYKTRNTGTGNVGNTRNGGNVIFRGMSPNIPENVLKHSGECHQTFRGMSSNIPGNDLKHSGECRQTLRGMSPNNPENIRK